MCVKLSTSDRVVCRVSNRSFCSNLICSVFSLKLKWLKLKSLYENAIIETNLNLVYSFSKRDLCQIFAFHQVSIFIFAYKTANFQHAQSAVKLKISLVCLKSLFSFPFLYYIIVCILLF